MRFGHGPETLNSPEKTCYATILGLNVIQYSKPCKAMDKTPSPIPLAMARNLPWRPGRSAEAFIDGDLEVRFTPRPSRGLQTPHERDELYFVASGTGHYRVGDSITEVGAGALLFAAAHVAHGFEDFSDDFSVWIIFYGPVKEKP